MRTGRRLLGALRGVPSNGRRWALRGFGWETVRGLGQLAILSRVSLLALILIPLVVAFWPAVRAVAGAYHRGLDETHSSVNRVLEEIEQAAKDHSVVVGDRGARLQEVLEQAGRASDRWAKELDALVAESPHIGATLALTFFAAVAVTLGLLVYQVWVPDEIRKHDIDAFVDRAHLRYPENASDRDDGLRRAIDHLETIAKRRPDRHASFVTHHGDTIWVPPRDRIDWFEDLPDETPSAVSEGDEGVADADQVPSVGAPASARGDEKKPSAREAIKRSGVVPGAERRRVVIEEGAKAEYWLKSREKIGAAAVSFGFYVVGIIFLLFVLGIQIGKVSRAAGW